MGIVKYRLRVRIEIWIWYVTFDRHMDSCTCQIVVFVVCTVSRGIDDYFIYQVRLGLLGRPEASSLAVTHLP